MNNKIIILILLLKIPLSLEACQCRQGINKNFFKNLSEFEIIVSGLIFRDEADHAFLKVIKNYKGNIDKSDTIRLWEGGLDCTEIFMEETNKILILGLNKENNTQFNNIYSSPACVTSILVLKKDKVMVEQGVANIHLKSPTICFLTRKMKLNKFENKLNNKI